MRKILLCIVIVFALLTACNTNYQYSAEDFIGKDRDYLNSLVPEDQRFDYQEYSFFEDSKGNPCVVVYGRREISDFYTFPKKKVDTSKATFEKIQKGMTIYEVVELVGIPHRTATSGFSTMVFQGDDGEYVIYFYASKIPCTVARIVYPE